MLELIVHHSQAIFLGFYLYEVLIFCQSLLLNFILIDDEQYALTKGWEKRLIKALDKVFGDIEASENKNLFIPKPTPLCHWCNFCTTNPEATIYKNECEYYSKWTPTQKTFEVNKKWNALENNNTEKKRKLVF